ncbi:Ppx/GppA phosphatase family protein [Desulfotomaculum copahuensis]|uniref:Ppx/GppA phosphatase family protein n=1 Tax=Desulfotomaculum copahuensis TaxID=1838280 RepID=UPI0031F36851
MAVVDIGTNSTRLLVADVTEGRKVLPVQRELATTRLGEGITTGRLRPEAVGRTVRVLQNYLDIARERKAALVLAAATSAVRDAANRDDFLAASRRAGLTVEVLSGQQEARLSYRGVLSGLPVEEASSVVMDVGGGSTEFIWSRDGRVHFCSVDVGAVRITEGGYDRRWLAGRLAAPLRRVKAAAPRTLVGVGGTVTTLAAMDLGLAVYDPDRVHGHAVTAGRVNSLLDQLEKSDLEERKRLPGLQPERADIIPAGVRIVSQVLKQLALPELKASEADIMHGLALEAVERKNVLTYQ